MTRHRLSHGWLLVRQPGSPPEIVREFLRPAVRAIPRSLAARLPRCRLALVPELPGASSQWVETEDTIEIMVAFEGEQPHDVAMEFLVCAGQALWEAAEPAERKAYLQLLKDEIEAGITGEIDEETFRQKQMLLSSPARAASSRHLMKYAGASFAGSAAEYIHCLWHDVTVREGPEHLPPEALRRRLEFFARRFPPNRGYRLFPEKASCACQEGGKLPASKGHGGGRRP